MKQSLTPYTRLFHQTNYRGAKYTQRTLSAGSDGERGGKDSTTSAHFLALALALALILVLVLLPPGSTREATPRLGHQLILPLLLLLLRIGVGELLSPLFLHHPTKSSVGRSRRLRSRALAGFFDGLSLGLGVAGEGAAREAGREGLWRRGRKGRWWWWRRRREK